MNSTVPSPVTQTTFSAQAAYEGTTLVAHFAGDAGLDARAALDGFVVDLHVCAQGSRVDVVIVDLRTLEFMNSSCFKSLVSWLGQIQEMPAESRYRVTFRSSPQMLWQRRSLHALRSLAIDIVTVEP